jgi:hypothetical protein
MSDPTLTGFENWPVQQEPTQSGAGGVFSTILPIVFGLLLGVGLGAWYVARPAGGEQRRSKPVTQQSWVSWSFSGQSGKSGKKKGMSWRDQLNKQAEDNNAELQRLQDDIQQRLNNPWR